LAAAINANKAEEQDMNVLLYASIFGGDKATVDMEENEYRCYVKLNVGDLFVVINDREKLLEISSLLEQAAQKWKVHHH
jgi:uncharacterized protein (DUF1015 family)